MFTTPDQSDAVPAVPPFSPVGPKPQGFFADCNPAANFDGTRPLAEHFNELIVNLRALLAKGRVTPAKGDATMLWRAIVGLLLIEQAVTFNVTPSGTAAPANPWAGDPFDSLAHALAFLAPYRIAAGVMVTINVAAGSYASTAPVVLEHPSGQQINVLGAGRDVTTLSFTGAIHGIQAKVGLRSLQNLRLLGDGGTLVPTPPGAAGIAIDGGAQMFCNQVTCEAFRGSGLSVSGALAFDGELKVLNNRDAGVVVSSGGTLNSATGKVTAIGNGGGGNVIIDGGFFGCDELATSGGAQGLFVGGSGASARFRKLGVDACTRTTQAIDVRGGATLAALGGAVAGDWWTWNTGANTAQAFYADTYGFIDSGAAMDARNRTNSSPAINTVGNIQAYIRAV